MIVERWTFATKDGCWAKMLELLKARRDATGEFEIFTCSFGSKQAFFATELRFEGLSDLDKFWQELGTTPDGAKFIQDFQALASDSMPATREIWQVQ